MKTTLKKVLLLAFVLGCGMQINAVSETKDKYSTYKEYNYVLLDDGTIKITRYNGNEEFIEIPESLDGYSITSIGDYAFDGCSSLNSITLPDSIKEIGANPFCGCSSLKKINVSPNHPVLEIIDELLYYKLDKRLVFCPTHKEKVTIPNGIQSIGDAAFSHCWYLNSITLPDSIKEIGVNPFYGCGSLKEINVSPDQPVLAIIDGLLYYKPDKRLVYCPTHKEKVTIPHGTQSIGDYAFYLCWDLNSITLPDSITSIGDYAFYSCRNLSSITLPDSITSIGDGAFYLCSSLSSITLPDSITSIGRAAFHGCSSLSSITLPDSITSIGDYAFSYCSSLSSITLPDSIKEIGANPFCDCGSLKNTNVSPDHPVLAIIDELLYYKPDKRLVFCPTHKEKVTIPHGVQSIGDYAFSGCSNLSSITLPDSITSIGNYAFLDCSSLNSITLPDSITSIGNKAFSGCSSLSSITLPDSITSIGNGAFYFCDNLIITVTRGSYAAQYCKKNSLQYTYTDSLDWLN